MGKLHHELDISLRNPSFFREFILKFGRQGWNDGGSPPFLLLPGGYQAADIPVQVNQFRIHSRP